ncbi:putative component of type VI protein secretion system [Paraburkholderia sp. WSM4175]
MNEGACRGLSGGYVLGKRLAYRSRAVRVTLRPAHAAQAHDLLPGAWLHRELMAFVQLYVGLKADAHLRMEMSSRLAPLPAINSPGPAAAGSAGPAPRLGWTTVLPAVNERVIDVALGVYRALPKPVANPYLTHAA